MDTTIKKAIQAAGVLLIFIVISVVIMNNKPQAKFKKDHIQNKLAVSAQLIEPTDHQFTLTSFGTIQPRTQSLLVSQVNGLIIEISQSFRDGGYFNKGDLLIRIDDRDYISAVNIARAELMQARLTFAEEKARANQASADWQRLGNTEKAPELVLRIPQLAVAEAKILSAQANFEKAQLNLTRTRITAPYDGRIKSKHVDVGQFVNSNAQLASVFATDVLEVRLPIKNDELPFIDLPESFLNNQNAATKQPAVVIKSELGKSQTWHGKIVRTEATLDTDSNQLYVIAQIDQPFINDAEHSAPLKIGEYVTAEIEGTKLTDAVLISNSGIYQGSYVYIIENELLQRRNITIGFQTTDYALITSGLTVGDQLVTSPLGQVSSGTPVKITNQTSKPLTSNLPESTTPESTTPEATTPEATTP